MKSVSMSFLAAGLLCFGFGAAQAANPMSEKEASPTINERITKDTVKGTLMKTEGEYYWIKDNDGKEVKIHVDKSTKMDKVRRWRHGQGLHHGQGPHHHATAPD